MKKATKKDSLSAIRDLIVDLDNTADLVAFIDEENDMWGCGMFYGDPIHIRDEITLLKIIDRIDNETALEKLEAL